MPNKFFEGADFRKARFKALMPAYYPQQYQQYIRQETALLKRRLKRASRVLEAGVGIGRLIPELAPLVGELVGIDSAALMLKRSRIAAKSFANVVIKKCSIEHLSQRFPGQHFEYSLCIWNTLGNVRDEVKALKALARVTSKSIFVTVYRKGTLKQRTLWYKAVDIPLQKIDAKKEIFYTASGLVSRSYGLQDLQRIAAKAGLRIKEAKVLAGVMLWVEMKKAE